MVSSQKIPPQQERSNWKKRFLREHEIRLETEKIAEEITRSLYNSRVLNVELERAKADLEQFTHMAAHDLREPLCRIESTAEFLESGLDVSAFSEENQKLFSILKNSVRHMRQLLDSFYHLVQVSKPALEFDTCFLGEIVKQCLNGLKDEIKRAGAEVHVDPLPQVSVYPILVEQLFKNLIENALKHSRGPGVKIHVTHEKISGVFGVKNSGSEIDPEFLEKIFLPLRRYGKHTEGTGLGLYICRKIVERHNGKIWAECGKNTVHFKFKLWE